MVVFGGRLDATKEELAPIQLTWDNITTEYRKRGNTYMAVLSRVNYLSGQRIDIPHLVASDSFNASDFRAFQKVLSGITNNYVIRGLEITAVNGLQVTVGVANTVVLCSLDNTSSFYVAGANESSVLITVPAGYPNIYIEAIAKRSTGTKIDTAFWDPSIPTNSNSAGSEFSAPVDFQEYVSLSISANTTGFSPASIKIAVVSSSSSQVTTVTNARESFFRLGSGGAVPNPSNNFSWSKNRLEPSSTGPAASIGTQSSTNPYFNNDGTGLVNDLGISSLKQWMDAVMTQIKVMNGTPYWYSPFGGSSSGTPPSVTLAQYDNQGRVSLSPSSGMVSWNGTVLSGTNNNPTAWRFSYGGVKVSLANAFIDTTHRFFPPTPVAFVSPTVPDGSSLFLRLRRELVSPTINNVANGGNSVKFGSVAIGGNAANICILGLAGDFTDLSIGSYIRRVGDMYFDYIQVVGISSGSTTGSPTIFKATGSTVVGGTVDDGRIADATIDGIFVSVPYSVPTVDKYLHFKAYYSSLDLYYTAGAAQNQVTNSAGDLISGNNADLLLIGSRNGANFILKDFGTLLSGNNNDNSRRVVAYTTGASTFTIAHGFVNPTVDFMWSCYNATTGAPIPITATQTLTGLSCNAMTAGLSLRFLFLRIN